MGSGRDLSLFHFQKKFWRSYNRHKYTNQAQHENRYWLLRFDCGWSMYICGLLWRVHSEPSLMWFKPHFVVSILPHHLNQLPIGVSSPTNWSWCAVLRPCEQSQEIVPHIIPKCQFAFASIKHINFVNFTGGCRWIVLNFFTFGWSPSSCFPLLPV